jgi:hypothetical protein
MVNKKFIVMMMVVIVVIGTITIGAYADTKPQVNVPGIVGAEHLETILDLEDRWFNGEFELDYMIEIVRVDGYWVVTLEGDADAYWDQMAIGIYTHAPTEEDIDFLWTTRVNMDTINDTIENYVE